MDETIMNKEELVKFLHIMFYNLETKTIDLSGLDFTKYKCNVDLSGKKVNGDLIQGDNDTGGNLIQGRNHVKGSLWDAGNIIDIDLWQGGNNVKRDLIESENVVKGNKASAKQVISSK